MTDATEIFERLKEDHDRHRELLDKLLETTGDSPDRQSLFEELTKELKSHAAAEEQALYSTMLRKPPTTGETRHSVAEHHEIDEALNDLAATDMSEGGWLTKFKTFEHQYRHHIDEEEEDPGNPCGDDTNNHSQRERGAELPGHQTPNSIHRIHSPLPYHHRLHVIDCSRRHKSDATKNSALEITNPPPMVSTKRYALQSIIGGSRPDLAPRGHISGHASANSEKPTPLVARRKKGRIQEEGA